MVVAETRGPSFSHMPKRMTICLAVAVTFSRSFAAPVVISLKTISSAARPPSVMAVVAAPRWVVRNLSSVGQRDRVAERLAAGDDRDLVDRVGVLEEVGDERVAHLVVRVIAAPSPHDPGLLLRAGDHAHDALFELVLVDLALALARGQQGGLVDEVGQVGAGEARRLAGERVEVDLLGQRLAARVDLEDLRRPLRSGRSTTTWRSKRPGRSRAGRGCRGGWWRR